MQVFILLFQVVDFVVKACIEYGQTPQGQKEIADIENAHKAVFPE